MIVRGLWTFLLILLTSCAGVEFEKEDGEEVTTSFDFQVSEEISSNDLLRASKRELQSYFDNGHRLADLDDAAFSMRQSLVAQGYPDTRVDFSVSNHQASDEKVTFEVKEGKQFWFGKFEVSGVDEAKMETVQKFFEFPGSGLLGAGRAYYQASTIKSSVASLESYYISDGYVDVQVEWESRKSEEVEDEYDSSIVVKSGEQYRFGGLAVETNNQNVDIASLQSDVDLYQSKTFTPTALVEVQNKLRTDLAEQGRLLTRIEQVVELDRRKKQANIQLKVKPGPVLKLRDVYFQGHERTDDDFILDRLAILPGETLERSKLDDAINRLYATGLFDHIKFSTENIQKTQDPAETDLELDLQEVDAQSVDIEAGFGSYELLRGGVRFRDRNVWGMGRDFEAVLRGSFRHVGADLRFIDPYTLGDSNIFRASLSVQRRDFLSFVSRSVSARLSVRHIIDSRTDIEGGYRFRLADATEIADAQDPDGENTFVTSSLFARFEHDGRNDVLLPTEGARVVISLEWSTRGLGASRDFFGVNAQSSYLFEIAEGTVLAFGAQFISRQILDGEGTLPIQERFFLGGESTVRSFRETELGPTNSTGDPIGGLTSIQGHVEFRQQLFGELHGALFYDVGSVSVDSFDVGELGHALGVGLRYLLPFGPARLDFAYNPGATFAANRNWAIHFAFGFSF